MRTGAATIALALIVTGLGLGCDQREPGDGYDPLAYATAVGIALLSGMVMSGIPGGGFLGELLIVTLYGFPVEALPLISMVGTLIDPPATMINATGDNVCSMLLARMLGGKHWMRCDLSHPTKTRS